jgi:glucokinase
MTAQSPSLGLPRRSAIGLDIGGTKIAGAVVADDGTVLELAEVPTPTTGDTQATLVALRQVIGSLREHHPAVEAIGVGAAGMVEWPGGHIRWAPNNAYRELPLRQLLARETGLPTVVDNDANVAAWAEARHGVAAGYGHVVVITVGTGIGAGVVLGGQLQRGYSGLGGEIGHIMVAPDGSQCGCGNTGCLEAMASGSALGRAGREAAATDPGGMLATLAGGAEKVTGQTVFDAAQRGDPTARGLFSQIGYWLGLGIASAVNLLDIEIVVIGGGLVTAGELLLAPTVESFRGFLFGRSRRSLPAIVPARFGPDAGVIGAATLALDHSRPHMLTPSTLTGGMDPVGVAEQLLLPVREATPLPTGHWGGRRFSSPPAPAQARPAAAFLGSVSGTAVPGCSTNKYFTAEEIDGRPVSDVRDRMFQRHW